MKNSCDISSNCGNEKSILEITYQIYDRNLIKKYIVECLIKNKITNRFMK